MKKLLSAIICLAMVLSLTVFAFPANAATEGDYEYEVADGNATITDYTGSGGAVTIPLTLGGYPVVEIDEGAFYDCTELTSITIPDCVTSIDSFAFSGCTSLTEIEVDTNSESFIGVGGVLFNRDSTVLVRCAPGVAGAYTVPDGVVEIGRYAFESCNKLTSIALPDGVESVGYGAFSCCAVLNSATMTDSVTEIGSFAFSYCTMLESVELSDSLTSISGSVFSGCSSLASIAIPEGVTDIGDNAFYSCMALDSVTIPESVVSIDVYAFSYCTGLVSVELSEGVTGIGNYAFNACSSLASVTIPDSLDRIGEYAFYDCTSLASITVPDSVTEIGGYSFTNTAYANDAANWIDGVLYIGNYLYKANDYVPSNYTVKDGTVRILNSAFIGCTSLESVVIPDSVEYIGYWAFGFCSELVSATIGSVTEIGNAAFEGCGNLASLPMSDGVRSIGAEAFSDCTSLSSIVIPDSVMSIGNNAFGNTAYYQNEANWVGGVLYIGNHLCAAKDTVSGEYTIKNGTIGICGGAFSDCTAITSVIMPDGLKYIGDAAFYGCTMLNSIIIPDSVISIGEDAFFDCSELSSISLGNGVRNIEAGAFTNCVKIASIVIPDSITEIKAYVFDSCTSLTSIVIPDSVMSIGEDAFFDCSELSSISLGNGVRNIEAGAFTNCVKISSIVIPDSITEIKAYVFDSCTSLTSIVIPDSVKRIGDSAFKSCSGLTSITIPQSVKSIGSGAFYGCTALDSISIYSASCNISGEVSIPTTTTVYGFAGSASQAYATANGNTFVAFTPSSITVTTLPTKTSYVVGDSFSSEGLAVTAHLDNGIAETVTANVSLPDMTTAGTKTVTVTYLDKTATFEITVNYMPEELFTYSVSGGKATVTGYTGTAAVVAVPPTLGGYPVTCIGNEAFKECTGLTSIVIPDSVTEIGWEAFEGCTELASVVIPDSVTILGYYAFDDTAYYNNSANWEDGVLYIGKHLYKATTDLSGAYTVKDGTVSICEDAFYECTELTAIVIPDSVKSIGSYAFCDCTALASITIPDSVTSIGYYAFDNTSYYNNSANWTDGELYIGKNLYKVNTDISGEYTVKDGTVSICDSAFYEYTGLTSIVIPDSVKSIDSYAFYNCTALDSVYIYNPSCDINYEAQIPTTATIYGYADSTAEAYATANGNTFVVISSAEHLRGDVDGDGSITTSDARLVLLYALGDVSAIVEEYLEAADCNGDGGIDTSDARLVLVVALG